MFSAGIILEIANLFRRHRGRSAIRETFPTRHFPRLRYSLICKHKKGLSKHEKDLSKHEKGLNEHEKGLSELNHTKMYREYNLSQKDLHTGTVFTDIRNNTTRDSILH